MEIWKKIEHLDKYLISNTGKLKNEKSGRILKTRVGKRGYLINTISVKGKIKLVCIHRMIALCFIPNPENKHSVNHIDGNKLNNSIENLEWVTQGENQKHAYNIGNKVGYWSGKFGKNHHRSRQVVRIEDNGERKIYDSITQASIENNVCNSNIVSVLKNKRKSVGGYRWEYLK